MAASRKQNEAPPRLRNLEARALRGNIQVKDALRESIRREVTRDGTMRDVHRIRNAGLSFFREADSNRLPKTHEDPVPKVRQQAVNKLVLVSSLELQKHFEERDERWFRHLTSPRRLQAIASPAVLDESEDFDDCEACQREREAATLAARRERGEQERAAECKVHLPASFWHEREAVPAQGRDSEAQEEFEEDTTPVLEECKDGQQHQQQQHEQQQQRQQQQQQQQALMHTSDDYESFEDIPSREGSGKSALTHTKDDYEAFEDNPSVEGSRKSALMRTKDDYESFEDTGDLPFEAGAVGRDATWVPGHLQDKALTSAREAEEEEEEACTPVTVAAPLPGGHKSPVAQLPRDDSILVEESERELLKEHLLCALKGRRSATPGTGKGPNAAAYSSAEPDYDDEGFENDSQSDPGGDAER